MAKPATTWLINDTTNDGTNTGNASGGAGGSGSNWVVIDKDNDTIMFLDTQQSDGDSGTGTIYPVLIPSAGTDESPKTFLNDNNTGLLNQVTLAGTVDGDQSGGNTRYVFAIYFDGATATVPYLEAWDTSVHSSSSNAFLGGGTGANSTLRAITTTNAVPGSTQWGGTPLAGTANRIALDSGALVGAKNVYFNLKQIIASTFSAQTNSAIVLTLRFTYS